ncbi:hypothetical protein [Nocardia sp. NRRL S-836]|uniref:hypothetical protein n=1 Tax=Nocardia sp. NRRL S-836 TaxID=1519492 RepID=UPI0006AF48EC|nr:hypothetical protein [Nocardia sp. NRRL S-836]KOV89690.1 hypothetical protein ADL03_02370 [Nocardia sp. NRRL S-836]
MSLPDEFHSLRNVQEWLRRMRDESASAALACAKATAVTWNGPASQAFDDYRHRARMRWLDTSEAFETAHDAVETYLHTVAEVARLSLGADGELLDRLEQQRAGEERRAVRAVDQAAEELWNVRSELPALPVVLTTAPRPPAGPPHPAPPQPPAPPPAAPEPPKPCAADFMAKPHVEGLVTSLALAARYRHWLRVP